MAQSAIKQLVNGINYLTPVDKQVASLHVAGMNTEQISIFLQTSTGVVSRILQKENVQRYILQFHASMGDAVKPWAEEMQAKLQTAADEAVGVIVDVMKDSHEQRDDIKRARLAMMSAKEILDMAGARAPKRVEVGEAGAFSIGDDEAKFIHATLVEDASRRKGESNE